jgi:hypothetical protein
MTTETNKPVDTIRDGALKATIWKNQSEKGAFYSVNFTRTYKDNEKNLQDGDSFTANELLRLSHLATKAYDRTSILRARDKLEAEASKLD